MPICPGRFAWSRRTTPPPASTPAARPEAKRYAYLIDNGAVPSPQLLRYAWHRPRPLDVTGLRQALSRVRGGHDFSAFCASAGRAADPVCRVRAVHVRRRKSLVAIVISADRFLHHMVRNLVGSAVEVGRGARPPDWMEGVLRARDRSAGRPHGARATA